MPEPCKHRTSVFMAITIYLNTPTSGWTKWCNLQTTFSNDLFVNGNCCNPPEFFSESLILSKSVHSKLVQVMGLFSTGTWFHINQWWPSSITHICYGKSCNRKEWSTCRMKQGTLYMLVRVFCGCLFPELEKNNKVGNIVYNSHIKFPFSTHLDHREYLV